ncbi:MAG: HDIG domain-containing metalloprotein [Aquificaceae bacterium]
MSEKVEYTKGIKHTVHGLNFYLSYFDDIARVLPKDAYCFVVGGWLRDRLLGESVGYNIDVDLLVTCDPTLLAKDFANLIKGSYFEFEKKGMLIKRATVATVILKLFPYKYRFDFAQVKGKDIEKALVDDLLSRDFTANAMAVSIDDLLSLGVKQAIIYDPAKGIEDLEQGFLRPVSLKNLEEDPVRILRGFRLSVEKNLQLTEDFFEFLKGKGSIIKKSPTERVTLEFFKVLRHRRSSEVIRKLYEHGVLEVIFPELSRLREVKDQGEHHLYPLDEHTIRVVENLDEVLENRERYISIELLKGVGNMHVHGEFSDLELLKLAALLHDIAKPQTFEIKNGKVTFYNHDKLGAQMVRNIGRRLKWGEDATEFVAKIVENHLRPFYLRESLRKDQLTDKGRAKFWRECESFAPHLFLHAIADSVGSGDSDRELRDLLLTIQNLERYKRERYNKIPIKPLLNGKEVMETFRIPQGPLVGRIKKALEEAQLEGLVKTKEQAIEFIKGIISQIQN